MVSGNYLKEVWYMYLLALKLIPLYNELLLWSFKLSSQENYNILSTLCMFLLFSNYLIQYILPNSLLLEKKIEQPVLWRQFVSFKEFFKPLMSRNSSSISILFMVFVLSIILVVSLLMLTLLYLLVNTELFLCMCTIHMSVLVGWQSRI